MSGRRDSRVGSVVRGWVGCTVGGGSVRALWACRVRGRVAAIGGRSVLKNPAFVSGGWSCQARADARFLGNE
eukprot:5514198-Prymnesium_polylepis.1